MERPGFRATYRKGFQITFDNGFTVSVQFGAGDYCDNYFARPRDPRGIPYESGTAEVAAFDPQGEFLNLPCGDQVEGYQTPAQVLQFMNEVASIPKPERKSNADPST